MTEHEFDEAFADDPDALERARRRARRAAERRESDPDAAHEDAASHDPALAHGRQEQTEPDAPRPVGAAASEPISPGPPPRRRPRVEAATGGPKGSTIRARRLFGLVALLAIAVVAYLAVNAIADRLGGSGTAEQPTDRSAARTGAGQTLDVTIPEGLDRSQVAEVAADAGIEGDYERASVSSKGFDPSKYGAEDPESLEGFLFPATYEIPEKDPSADELASQQTQAFADYFNEVDLGYAKSKNLTPYDVVIIASMIEREVSVASERPLVAAVIYNRLSQGMPLGIDATIRFATGNFDAPLLESELAIDSPYNTRINAGLPPGPIGNPGLDSLKAAAKPAKVDYLYYVIEPGTCNRHVFTADEAEFTEAAAAYQAALEAEGGSPTSC